MGPFCLQIILVCDPTIPSQSESWTEVSDFAENQVTSALSIKDVFLF